MKKEKKSLFHHVIKYHNDCNGFPFQPLGVWCVVFCFSRALEGQDIKKNHNENCFSSKTNAVIIVHKQQYASTTNQQQHRSLRIEVVDKTHKEG